ncbi:MAG: AAA family ATPase [Pirellulaceae bacterium]
MNTSTPNISQPPTKQPSTSDSPAQLDKLLERIDGLIKNGGQTPARSPAAAPAQPSKPAQPSQSVQSTPAAQSAAAVSSARPAETRTCKFGRMTNDRDEPFIPTVPTSLQHAGVTESLAEELIMRFLLGRGEASGRAIAEQVKLPFLLIEPILNRLKYEQMTAYRGANSVNDYIHVLTDQGRDRARQHTHRTTYFGAAPVRLEDYCEAVKLQSVEGQYPRREELLHAFRDLLIDKRMLGKLGPAINSGRGMFLYGYPGNGKTSIAERITMAFGKYIWIPRSLSIDGEIMRLYDPLMHEPAEAEKGTGLLDESGFDGRWIRIKRPTIIAGGELTMEMLEAQMDKETNINESPLQLKSNCGVLVIDDFGRQKMRVDELLNRWIVPLEKRFDYLNMSSGKKTQVPFDQLVIFSTNLQPKDLVDDAFLRRIPYKIEVENPSEAAFRKLFEIMCPKMGLPYKQSVIEYLIETHYKPINRPFRNCHPRDLLLQVRNYCLYHDQPMDLRNEFVDFACENYFSIM